MVVKGFLSQTEGPRAITLSRRLMSLLLSLCFLSVLLGRFGSMSISVEISPANSPANPLFSVFGSLFRSSFGFSRCPLGGLG